MLISTKMTTAICLQLLTMTTYAVGQARPRGVVLNSIIFVYMWFTHRHGELPFLMKSHGFHFDKKKKERKQAQRRAAADRSRHKSHGRIQYQGPYFRT